jgi:hypothetical protein
MKSKSLRELSKAMRVPEGWVVGYDSRINQLGYIGLDAVRSFPISGRFGYRELGEWSFKVLFWDRCPKMNKRGCFRNVI